MLVQQHRDVAFRVAFLLTGSAADAEDATQDGFMKAYTQIRRFKPGATFRPWLLKIVGNEARNLTRSGRRRLSYETRAGHQPDSESATTVPETAAVTNETDQRLIRAVNDLPEKERLVIGLRYFLELSESEAAAAAGIPRGTVKSRMSRGLERLRTQVGDLDA